MNRLIAVFSCLCSLTILLSCSEQEKSTNALPKYGNKEIVDGDTIFHRIPQFTFINQDSQVITNSNYSDAIYVADFFFTSCPTICPKVKSQMLRIENKYIDNPHVKLLSHSIDTRRDSVPRLKDYAEKLGIESGKWNLVTGDKDEIFDIAREYLSVAIEDESVPGGFDHSGNIILVDNEGYIRGFANGTLEEDVTKLLTTIDILLDEKGW